MTSQRVVVTGMGFASPMGSDEASFWSRMISGQGAVRHLTSLDTSNLKTVCGAEIDDEAYAAAIPSFIPSNTDRVTAMALASSYRALVQAGLRQDTGQDRLNPLAIPVIVGTGNGPSRTVHDTYESYNKNGPRAIRPTAIPRGIINAISAQISMHFCLTGPNYALVSACSSATAAIGSAFRLIRHGYAEQALCGGAESVFVPSVFAAWNNLGVMSKNTDPAKACRPFDAQRDGFVLGEGAGMLVLESMDSARRRGVPVRAELCGFGESSDAGHITRPDPQGQAAAITACLADAGLQPNDIGYINAHGTATKANDLCESQSIRLALGDAADNALTGSSKSYFGHLLGAAGALETLTAILALENGMIPPNINLVTPDPECRLNLAGREAVPLPKGSAVLKNSFGFGGYNTVLAFMS